MDLSDVADRARLRGRYHIVAAASTLRLRPGQPRPRTGRSERIQRRICQSRRSIQLQPYFDRRQGVRFRTRWLKGVCKQPSLRQPCSDSQPRCRNKHVAVHLNHRLSTVDKNSYTVHLKAAAAAGQARPCTRPCEINTSVHSTSATMLAMKFQHNELYDVATVFPPEAVS